MSNILDMQQEFVPASKEAGGVKMITGNQKFKALIPMLKSKHLASLSADGIALVRQFGEIDDRGWFVGLDRMTFDQASTLIKALKDCPNKRHVGAASTVETRQAPVAPAAPAAPDTTAAMQVMPDGRVMVLNDKGNWVLAPSK